MQTKDTPIIMLDGSISYKIGRAYTFCKSDSKGVTPLVGVQGAKPHAKQEREDSVLAKEQECEDGVLTTQKGRIFHGETLGWTLHAVHG